MMFHATEGHRAESDAADEHAGGAELVKLHSVLPCLGLGLEQR
jgi:hypothetical protein